MTIKTVIIQPEGVIYPGISMDYLCDPDADASEAASRLSANEYLSRADMNTWTRRMGTGFNRLKHVLAMIGDLISGPWPGSFYKPEEILDYQTRVNERLAGIFSSVESGVEMEKIRNTARSTQLTKGAMYTMSAIGSARKKIFASYDLSPFLYAIANRIGADSIDSIEAAPVSVNGSDGVVPFSADMLDTDCSIVGDFTGPYDPLGTTLDKLDCKHDETLIVAGSYPSMNGLKKAKDEGMYCIGFNPGNEMLRSLQYIGVPLLLQSEPDMSPISDIASDPEKIKYYCQT